MSLPKTSAEILATKELSSSDYTELCKQTEATDWSVIQKRLQEPGVLGLLDHLFTEMTSVGTALDDLKKYIFYGKGKLSPAAFDKDIRFIPASKFQEDVNLVRALHGVIGAATEVPEMMQPLVNYMLYSENKIDRINLLEEFGDCQWYLAVGIDALGSTLNEVRGKAF